MGGNLPEISPDKHVRLQGLWGTHPKHDTQSKAELCEQILTGWESYLYSGMIKSICQKMAKRTVG